MKEIWFLERSGECRSIYRDIFAAYYDLRFLSDIGDLERCLQVPERACDLLITELQFTDGFFLRFLLTHQVKSPFPFPFVIVTHACNEEMIRTCIDEGALDFFLKPFHHLELKIKIERLLEPSAGKNHFGDLVIDTVEKSVSNSKGQRVELTPRELQILVALSDRTEKKVPRSELMFAVWKDIKVGSRTLDVHLYNLRKKIKSVGYDVVFSAPDLYFIVKSDPQE